MKKVLLTGLFAISSIFSFSQNRILVFHETNQFRHSSINAGISMFEDLGNENNEWITDNSQDSSVFNASNLAQYDVVVFLNTSGSDENGGDGDLLSASEKIALENFIANGKGFIGVHAATDTYRDGSWPFYNELVGGIVQTNPNHTSNNYNADISIINTHPTTNDIVLTTNSDMDMVWNKNEEYYYWEQNGGQLSTDNTILLEVESTGNNSYDAARPITWLKESITYDDDNNAATEDITLSGFRSFYTALGHNSDDYNSNSNFRTMLKNATLWAIGDEVLSVVQENITSLKLFPNPAQDHISIALPITEDVVSFVIYNSLGQDVLSKTIEASTIQGSIYQFNIKDFEIGVYVMNVYYSNRKEQFKIIKN